MSASPRTISPGSTLAQAHRMMRGAGIRHLPVCEKGVVVGVLSARDLLLLESLPKVDANEARVYEAMVRDVFAVEPSAPLGEVVETMIARKLGSAVVVDGPNVVGVLTTIDALQALHELLERGPE
ncbi:MAG TPA: CBS domain-containing protein [Polyangia bacterium]|nr:CBS domain-containing protein [Polyangia bacterium]